MAGVLGSMQRATRRATRAPGAEAGSQSGAGDPPHGARPLSALPRRSLADCEVCDGAGVVTQRRASEWLDERAPHRLD